MTADVDREQIARAVAILKRGGLVAVPTETVYGLAADAENETAVRAIFEAKGRPADHPVIVHIAEANQVPLWAREIPGPARALAAAFWPGPLTLVLKRSDRSSDLITGGQDTVGLRCPAHPWARALLQAYGGALAAPSANSFGRISPTTADHVRGDLGEKPAGRVDLILDGGPCPLGIESTIVDLSGSAPSILRPGAITQDMLERTLGMAIPVADASAPRASGRLEKHYAPRTPLEIVPADQLHARIEELADLRLAVLAPLRPAAPAPHVLMWCSAAPNADDYAQALYAELHRMDAAGADRLLAAAPPSGPEWVAVRDRLWRAEAGAAPEPPQRL